MKKLCVSAPGRLCLLGEHQDYFGLPIIAAAINLRITIAGKRRDDDIFSLDLPDINKKEKFSFKDEVEYSQERDYLKSVVNVLRRNGLSISSGWDDRVQGTIPINSGTSSSSALVIAWIKFLLESENDPRAGRPEDIAELGFLSEVAEFKEPGGKMDHFASAIGGIVNIHFGESLSVRRFNNPLKEFVLADSLIRKNTTGTMNHIKSNVYEGLKKIREKIPGFDLGSVLGTREETEIEKLPTTVKQQLKGTLMTRDITAEGEKLFKSEYFSHEYFGRLLSRQQKVIKDYLQISAPKIDRMIEVSLEAGALGAKINGSGQGGCIFAYAPERAEDVAEALKRLDTQVFLVNVDEGARVEYVKY